MSSYLLDKIRENKIANNHERVDLLSLANTIASEKGIPVNMDALEKIVTEVGAAYEAKVGKKFVPIVRREERTGLEELLEYRESFNLPECPEHEKPQPKQFVPRPPKTMKQVRSERTRSRARAKREKSYKELEDLL